MTHVKPFSKCSLSWAPQNFPRANTRGDDYYHVQVRKLRLTEEGLAYGLTAGSREGNTGREPKFPLYRLSLLLNTCPGGRGRE